VRIAEPHTRPYALSLPSSLIFPLPSFLLSLPSLLFLYHLPLQNLSGQFRAEVCQIRATNRLSNLRHRFHQNGRELVNIRALLANLKHGNDFRLFSIFLSIQQKDFYMQKMRYTIFPVFTSLYFRTATSYSNNKLVQSRAVQYNVWCVLKHSKVQYGTVQGSILVLCSVLYLVVPCPVSRSHQAEGDFEAIQHTSH
jgi:hypothetical protein